MIALDIITAALMEINAVAQGETPNNGDAQFALAKLNSMLDSLAARKVYLYNSAFPVYTLVAGLLPHTIGPMGQLTQSSRANNVATFVAANNFTNGGSVTVFDSTNGLDLTGNVQAATAAQFSVASIGANVALAADAGSAIPAANPAPTFATPNMGQRPMKMQRANLILNAPGPPVELPMNIRDEQWWMNNRVKTLSTDIPTDVYYSPDWPNGSLYFWPVPTIAYQVRLEIWGAIPQFPSVSYAFSLPPGYQEFLTLKLARNMVGAFQGSWSPQQEDAYKLAAKGIETNNLKSPRGATADAGMPGSKMRGGFNWETGGPA